MCNVKVNPARAWDRTRSEGQQKYGVLCIPFPLLDPSFNRRVTRAAAMRKSRSKSGTPPKPDWAANISELRQRLNLSQTVFGGRLNSSAMSVSRWERGNQEPSADSYIELGNLAGAPVCWYFWSRPASRRPAARHAYESRGTIQPG